MNANDYLRARAVIQSDFDTKLASLNAVWAMLHPREAPPEPIESYSDAVSQIRGAWRLVAQQVLDQMPADSHFTIREIEDGITQTNPAIATDKVQISIFLKKLADSGKLEIAEAGAGRRATVYIKPK